MDIISLRDFCIAQKGVEEGFPFDEKVLVFKVGGKIFCLTDVEEYDMIILKADPEKAVELREQYEKVVPGYHMSKKHWNSILIPNDIPDRLIKEWIKDSYELVLRTLPKKIQAEIEVVNLSTGKGKE